jgi:hypothetical protein
MLTGGDRPLARLVVVVAAAVAVMALPACGGSDDDGGAGATAAGSSDAVERDERGTRDEVDAGAGDDDTAAGAERAIRARYREFVDAVYAADLDAACAMLTASAREQLAGERTCEEAMGSRVGAESLSPNRPYIVKLRVRGDRAQLRAKTKNSEAYPVPLVEQDGEWMFDGGF